MGRGEKEKREGKERREEEKRGRKGDLKTPWGVRGVLLERAQGAHARPSTPRDLAPP